MITCDDDCSAACDFCVYFRDGHEITGEYDGVCARTGEETDRSSYCDEFHCFRVKSPKLYGGVTK